MVPEFTQEGAVAVNVTALHSSEELGDGDVLDGGEALRLSDADVIPRVQDKLDVCLISESQFINDDVHTTPVADVQVLEVTEDHCGANTAGAALGEVVGNEVGFSHGIAVQLAVVVEEEASGVAGLLGGLHRTDHLGVGEVSEFAALGVLGTDGGLQLHDVGPVDGGTIRTTGHETRSSIGNAGEDTGGLSAGTCTCNAGGFQELCVSLLDLAPDDLLNVDAGLTYQVSRDGTDTNIAVRGHGLAGEGSLGDGALYTFSNPSGGDGTRGNQRQGAYEVTQALAKTSR